MKRGFWLIVGILALFLAACVTQEKVVTVPSDQQIATQKAVPLTEAPDVTIATCEKAINAVSYVACVDVVAVKESNPALCDKITEKYPAGYTIGDQTAAYNRDVCIFNYFDNTNDRTVCKDIADEDLRFSCLNELR